MSMQSGSPEYLGLRFGWIYSAGLDRGWRALQQVIDDFLFGKAEIRFPDLSVSHDSFEGDSKGAAAVIQLGEPADTRTSDHSNRPAHRPRPEDYPQIHRTQSRGAGLWASPGRPARQD